MPSVVELVTVAELHHGIDRAPAQLVKKFGWVTRLATVEPGE